MSRGKHSHSSSINQSITLFSNAGYRMTFRKMEKSLLLLLINSKYSLGLQSPRTVLKASAYFAELHLWSQFVQSPFFLVELGKALLAG